MIKDIFIEKYKKPNVIKDWKEYFKIIKELKLYLVKFEINNIIKAKKKILNYIIEDDNY